MRVPLARFLLILPFLVFLIWLASQAESQEPPAAFQPIPGQAPAAEQAPDVPKGVEVMARGPIHEAFASPSQEAKATQPVPKKPPAPIEEMAPEERPEGDVAWIGGYWAYDDDRKDFLWVSGCWRVKPENKEWVPGYWREVGTDWQWVPGFWAGAAVAAPGAAAPAGGVVQAKQEVTYYPDPPAPPNLAAPGDPPAGQPDQFYVPGYYQWSGTHYVWRAGYWMRIRPGYTYVPSHYRWTPYGYVFVPGYWDYAVARRGVLYAPVVVESAVVPVTFVYTPAYAVSDGIVLDALFIRPTYCHYYFGDYYGPQYATIGFEPCVVYSRRSYEPIIVYQRWEYRDNPQWYSAQINITLERGAGRAPRPPRTLVEQQTMIVQNNVTNNYFINNSQTTINNSQTTVNNVKSDSHNTTVVQKPLALAPAKTIMASKGITATPLDAATRTQVKQASQAVQQTAMLERKKTELAPVPAGAPAKPKTVSLAVPPAPVAPTPKTAATSSTGPNGQPGAAGAAKGSALGPPPGGLGKPPAPAGAATGQPHPNPSPTPAGSTGTVGKTPQDLKDLHNPQSIGGSKLPPQPTATNPHPNVTGTTGAMPATGTPPKYNPNTTNTKGGTTAPGTTVPGQPGSTLLPHPGSNPMPPAPPKKAPPDDNKKKDKQ
jgi:hypothetical protein